MGKLIYMISVSLDGFAATSDGGVQWGNVDEELHAWFNDQTRSIDASLYGRRMYELMAAHWPTAEEDPSSTEVEREFARLWTAMPKIVFSRTLDHVEHNGRLVRVDVGTVLDHVRGEFDGNLDIGGPNLAGQFIRRGLVDEYRLVVHPVVLGRGLPFWPELDAPLKLELVEAPSFSSGSEARTYLPV